MEKFEVINDFVQILALGVGTGFGSAIGTEIGKLIVKKLWKEVRRLDKGWVMVSQ
jgi:hypothetical protein